MRLNQKSFRNHWIKFNLSSIALALRLREAKLLAGFAALIILMAVIGLAGISQIQSLSKIVDELGKRNLNIEKSILEMKINNTLYAMGVRNFAFWQTSKYLGAVFIAANLEAVYQAAENFDRELKNYVAYVSQPQQQEWVRRLSQSTEEFRGLGEQIIQLAKQEQKPETINNLLMAFENRFYRINEFLDETMAKANFAEIDQKIHLGYLRRTQAMTYLFWVLILGVAFGISTAGYIYYTRLQERRRAQVMLRQMINTEERERQNLSAQVHDQMNQDLGALKIYLGMFEQDLPSIAQAQSGHNELLSTNLNKAKAILSGLIEKTHNICLLLRPPVLDEFGPVESIGALILEYKQLTNINYVYQRPDREIKLPPEYCLFLYRLAQETLTNAIKHAQAKNIQISLNQRGGFVEFSFKDDGIGFVYNQIIKRLRRRQEDRFKLGLVGLKERAELLGGLMRINSAPGKGTSIIVKLPV